MRKALANVLTAIGLCLGAMAAGAFVYLIWPDLDLYGARAIRQVTGLLLFACLIYGAVGWPFFWIADRIQGD